MTRQYLIDLGLKYPKKWILVKDDANSYVVFNSKQEAIEKSHDYLYLVHGDKIIELANEEFPKLDELLIISKLDNNVFFLYDSRTGEFQRTTWNVDRLGDRKSIKKFILAYGKKWTHAIVNGYVFLKLEGE